jgi:hypothetical protein
MDMLDNRATCLVGAVLISSIEWHRTPIAATFAAVLGLCSACGGGGDAEVAEAPQHASTASPTLNGARVSNAEQAQQIVARGIAAPLQASAQAHAELVRALEWRVSALRSAAPVAAGDRWVMTHVAHQGPVRVEIEHARNAEGLLLRGEPGHVRALLRFEPSASSVGQAHVEGAITVEAVRTAGAAGPVRRSQADALSFIDGGTALRWSYLSVELDGQGKVRRFGVVSDVPVDHIGRVWVDVTLAGDRYVAAGVLAFLQARLSVRVGGANGCSIEVDNDRDGLADLALSGQPGGVRLPGC